MMMRLLLFGYGVASYLVFFAITIVLAIALHRADQTAA